MRQVNLESQLTETFENNKTSQWNTQIQNSLLDQKEQNNQLDQGSKQVSLNEMDEVQIPKLRRRAFRGYNSQNRNKTQWSQQEDELLLKLKVDNITWRRLSQEINQRLYNGTLVKNAKQVRERWNNYLNPDLIKGDWQEQENEMLIKLYKQLGPKWSQISKTLKTRNENQVKSHMLTLLDKMQKQMKGKVHKKYPEEQVQELQQGHLQILKQEGNQSISDQLVIPSFTVFNSQKKEQVGNQEYIKVNTVDNNGVVLITL